MIRTFGQTNTMFDLVDFPVSLSGLAGGLAVRSGWRVWLAGLAGARAVRRPAGLSAGDV